MRPLLVFCLLILPANVFALNAGLGPGHYGEAMEFYYLRPKPELLAPMLRNFSERGILARGEKRMFVAAFLATLARQKTLDLSAFLPPRDQNQKLTLAWSLHLAGQDASGLLADLPAAFANQIRNTPPDLHAWNPAWESSVLGMYWAAFMASGDAGWVNAIITAALAKPGTPMAEKAAASLYDYAPGHELIQTALAERLQTATGSSRERLKLILEHAALK